jgi:hypothetical protein
MLTAVGGFCTAIDVNFTAVDIFLCELINFFTASVGIVFI